jgi:hypothetical protein
MRWSSSSGSWLVPSYVPTRSAAAWHRRDTPVIWITYREMTASLRFSGEDRHDVSLHTTSTRSAYALQSVDRETRHRRLRSPGLGSGMEESSQRVEAELAGVVVVVINQAR